MCLAIPAKIIRIEGKKALVKQGNHTHKVDISLVSQLEVGDFVLTTHRLAIGKIPPLEAKNILKMSNKTIGR